ncbi:uncharacterized protein LOC114661525 [Erpetoichthys calabaricus]|uniref:uncharacterized protein LOC114661525 n=1 Tax=Erpetoichthys calabaricus TaxID=27687 RepID=UPI00109FBF41|nr:uncharacterized protein LOC114661525 [Erpetoichthys calabaricus]
MTESVDRRFHNLTMEQIQTLNQVLTEVIPIHGRGNFPTLEVKPKDIIHMVKDRLIEKKITVRDVRLNGSTASHVLVKENGTSYKDLDIIFGVELPKEEDFQIVKDVVLDCLLDFLPRCVNKEKITALTMKEAYVQKMVKVFTEHDRWSLISLSNNSGKNVELKFVNSLRRQFEFSVDSFQIILDRILESYRELEKIKAEKAAIKQTSNLSTKVQKADLQDDTCNTQTNDKLQICEKLSNNQVRDFRDNKEKEPKDKGLNDLGTPLANNTHSESCSADTLSEKVELLPQSPGLLTKNDVLTANGEELPEKVLESILEVDCSNKMENKSTSKEEMCEQNVLDRKKLSTTQKESPCLEKKIIPAKKLLATKKEVLAQNKDVKKTLSNKKQSQDSEAKLVDVAKACVSKNDLELQDEKSAKVKKSPTPKKESQIQDEQHFQNKILAIEKNELQAQDVKLDQVQPEPVAQTELYTQGELLTQVKKLPAPKNEMASQEEKQVNKTSATRKEPEIGKEQPAQVKKLPLSKKESLTQDEQVAQVKKTPTVKKELQTHKEEIAQVKKIPTTKKELQPQEDNVKTSSPTRKNGQVKEDKNTQVNKPPTKQKESTTNDDTGSSQVTQTEPANQQQQCILDEKIPVISINDSEFVKEVEAESQKLAKKDKVVEQAQTCSVEHQELIDEPIELLAEARGTAYETTKIITASIENPTADLLSVTVVAESMYGDFEQAMDHLRYRLIATRNPEEIRGGGLLKYSNLLVREFRPASETEIKTLERYMCSRFFIDFPDVNEQQRKIESYLRNHFIGEEKSKYDYLMTLRRVVNESTVCLMGHERRQTLNMITILALKVLGEQNIIPNTANVTCYYQPAPYISDRNFSNYYIAHGQPPIIYHPYPLHIHMQTGLV